MKKHKYSGKVYHSRMLEKLSSQYYIGRLYVEPLRANDAEYGRIRQDAYDAIRRELYGKTLVEPPLVMKIETKHILLKPATNVPQHTAKIAKKTLEDLSIKNPPSLEEVFFPTKEAIERFNSMGFFPSE